MGLTRIEWAHYTFNPWLGCVKVSPECDGCYAETWAKRSGLVVWGAHEPRRKTSPAYWRQPLKWDADAAASGDQAQGERRRVFCGSLCDVGEEGDPMLAVYRSDLARLIDDTPHLDWLLLTKRAGAWPRLLSAGMPRRIWAGVTVGCKSSLWRVDQLRGLDVAVRFLSVEPLLEDIAGELDLTGIDWVIVGGESGAKARPMHPVWVKRILDRCLAKRVSFFFKQWGEWLPIATPRLKAKVGDTMLLHVDGTVKPATWSDVMNTRGDVWAVQRAGKKAAGRTFWGATWSQVPEVKAA